MDTGLQADLRHGEWQMIRHDLMRWNAVGISGASDLGFGDNGNANDMSSVESNFVDAWQDQTWFANDIVF